MALIGFQKKIAGAQAAARRLQEGGQSQAARVAAARQAAPPPPPSPPAYQPLGAPPVPWAQTEAGVTFAGQQQKEALAIQAANEAALAKQQQAGALIIQQKEQAFQQEQQEKRIAAERQMRAEERERQRQANIAQLRVERQGAFSQMMKSGDQVRAVMFALGHGPESDVFDVRARQLGTTVKELKGAQELRATTETALGRVLGRGVTIGKEGVRGLGTAIGAARVLAQGGVDMQTLLTSAFGVGSLRAGEQPGISGARLQELVQSVTPTGVL